MVLPHFLHPPHSAPQAFHRKWWKACIFKPYCSGHCLADNKDLMNGRNLKTAWEIELIFTQTNHISWMNMWPALAGVYLYFVQTSIIFLFLFHLKKQTKKKNTQHWQTSGIPLPGWSSLHQDTCKPVPFLTEDLMQLFKRAAHLKKYMNDLDHWIVT